MAIVGGGIAGYSAALTAKNLKLNYLWLGDKNFGKKTVKAEYVRNYPAFMGDGEGFVRTLEKQKTEEGILLTEKRIDGVYKDKNGFFLTEGKENFSARAVILATGVELSAGFGDDFIGRGVSYCAVCDGALYKNKKLPPCSIPKRKKTRRSILLRLPRKCWCFQNTPLHFKRKISA